MGPQAWSGLENEERQWLWVQFDHSERREVLRRLRLQREAAVTAWELELVAAMENAEAVAGADAAP